MSKRALFFLWVSLILILVSGVVSVTFFLDSKAIPKIKWSEVADEKTMFGSILHVFQPVWSKSNRLWLGIADKKTWKSPVLQGWIRSISPQFSLVWVDQELLKVMVVDWRHAAVSHWEDHLCHSAQKTLCITSLAKGSFRIENSLAAQKSSPETLHLLVWELSSPQIGLSPLPCQRGAAFSSLESVGCELQKISIVQKRKIRKTKGLGFSLHQISSRDFLWIWVDERPSGSLTEEP